MKKVKAQIKSDTRVKSMLDFSNDEEYLQNGEIAKNNSIPAENGTNIVENDNKLAKNDDIHNDGVNDNENENIDAQKLLNEENAGIASGAQDLQNLNQTTAKESTANENSINDNGVVVLKRARGDVVVSGQAEEEADEPESAEAEVSKKSRHIVEIGSKTYSDDGVDEPTAHGGKKTFKEYMKSAGTAIAQGWDTFINKKGAVRLLAIIAIFVMLTIALVIYSASQRANIKDIVNGTCNAFIYDAGEFTGTGSNEKVKLDTFLKNTPSEKLCKNYSMIEFVGKTKKDVVNIDSISFGLYTDLADVTILIDLAIYYGDEKAWALNESRVVVMSQRIGNGVNFQIGQGFDFSGATSIRMTFACYNTESYNKFGADDAERVNPQFAIYKLAYTK